MVLKGGGVVRTTGIKRKIKQKSKSVSEEHRPEREEMLYSAEKERDEWDTLLDRSKLWRTLRVTAWALPFKHNSLTKRHKTKKITRPLTTEELSYAKDQWIRKEQAEENTGIFKWLSADVH